MDASKVDLYLMTNSKFFPAEKLFVLREHLEKMDEAKFNVLSAMQLKDPVIYLVVSFFVGSFGADRFMVGDIMLGVLKLCTLGLCGLWTIIDWFLILGRAREVNFNVVMNAISNQ